MIVLPIVLSVVLCFINFFSDELLVKDKKIRFQLKNFTAGITLTYILLHLIPKNISQTYNEIFFGFILLSLIVFNVIESHIYNAKSIAEKKRELMEEHTASFVVYNFFIGASLWYFFSKGIIQGIVFFIPVSLHHFISTASLRELYYGVKKKKIFKFTLSLTPLIGVLIVSFFSFPNNFFRAVTGLVTGGLIYVVFRELIPSAKGTTSKYFILGILTMIGFLMIDFLGG